MEVSCAHCARRGARRGKWDERTSRRYKTLEASCAWFAELASFTRATAIGGSTLYPW